MKSEPVNLSFKEVESLGILRRFQHHLYFLSGLTFDFVDTGGQPSTRLKAVKRYASFCRLIYRSPHGYEACKKCDAWALENCAKTRKPIIYNCHMGLVEIIVPLIMNGEILGFLTSGQFLSSKPGKKQFKKIESAIKRFGISPAEARKHYFAIPVIREEKTKTIVDLISIIAEYVIETENKILELRKIAHKDKIQQAREFIRAHHTEQVSLRDVASAVSLSGSRLAHLFKERMNTTITSYINELRVDTAKNLLSNTDLKIIEVAFRSGFRNLSHFNHTFKGKTGLSPTKYRKTAE